MILSSLQVSDFRNLENVNIQLNPNLNVFIGLNGSGKSSLLEAVHYMGYGRSFRTGRHASVIQHGKDRFVIHCKTSEGLKDDSLSVGLSRSKNEEFQVSIDGQKGRRLSDLVSRLPIQIFTPQSSDLILGAPGLRRKFLDWVVFHVEHSFSEASSNFNRALKQRNALLKKVQKAPHILEQESAQIDYWTKLVAHYGELIDGHRRDVFVQLSQCFQKNLAQFVTEFSLEISYHRGWDSESELYSHLRAKLQSDLKYGYTSSGPQKCDLTIKADSENASEVLSRGQLRMLVAAMQLSQSEYLADKTGKRSIFLLDDIAAELDEGKRQAFVNLLLACESQVILTAINVSQLSFLEKHKNKKVFHVEHGQVNEE